MLKFPMVELKPGRRTVGILVFVLTVVFQIAAADITVDFKVFPQSFALTNSHGVIKPSGIKSEWRSFRLPSSRQSYVIVSEGYRPYFLSLDPQKNRKIELKLERVDSKLRLVGEFPTGSQPKSVVFTPDGNHALVAQLSGNGLDLYACDPFRWIKQIDLPPLGKHNESGFVEFAILPWRDEIWVSQMTTGQIRVIRLSDFTYKTSFTTGGEWSKVICIHPDQKRAFVSNWLSETVSVIDIEQRKVLRTVRCSGIPRGLAVSPDGAYLWVAIFGNGNLDKIRLSDLKRVKTLSWPTIGAKRHIILHPNGKTMYVNDMATGEVWVFDLNSDKLVNRIYIGPKLNTCAISPDGRFLFISSRGTNNPIEDYLVKGPDFGTVSVLDTDSLRKVDWVWGRNQPTGLAVNPQGTRIAFTDFLDNNLELYDITGLNAANPISKSDKPDIPVSAPNGANSIPWFIDMHHIWRGN